MATTTPGTGSEESAAPSYDLIFRLDRMPPDAVIDAAYDSGLDCMISQGHDGVVEVSATVSGTDRSVATAEVLATLTDLGMHPMPAAE